MNSNLHDPQQYSTVAIQAAWIVPVTSDPIRDGWIVCESGVIRFVGKVLPDQYGSIPKFRLPEQAIVPGLINSHCHLEFSDLDEPIAYEGSFVKWIGNVVRHRREQNQKQLDEIKSHSQQINLSDGTVQYSHMRDIRKGALLKGLREAYSTGTRFVLDMITDPWDMEMFREVESLHHGVKNHGEKHHIEKHHSEKSIVTALIQDAAIYYHPCPEVLDINQVRARQTLDFAEQVHSQLDSQSELPLSPQTAVLTQQPKTEAPDSLNGSHETRFVRVVAATSWAPHAPYTSTPDLVSETSHRTDPMTGVLSLHLAESWEEKEWLESGTGPMESSLDAFRDETFKCRLQQSRKLAQTHAATSVFDSYLKACAGSRRVLLAHGNEFSEQEIARIAQGDLATSNTKPGGIPEDTSLVDGASSERQSVAIVLCPRTYKHFHPEPNAQYPLEQRLEQGAMHLIGTDSRASNPNLNLFQELLFLTSAGIRFTEALSLATSRAAEFFGLDGLGSIQEGKLSLLTVIDCKTLAPGHSENAVSDTSEVAEQMAISDSSSSRLDALNQLIEEGTLAASDAIFSAQPLELVLRSKKTGEGFFASKPS